MCLCLCLCLCLCFDLFCVHLQNDYVDNVLLELIVALELSESPDGQEATRLRRIMPLLMGEKDPGGRYGAFPFAKVPRRAPRDALLVFALLDGGRQKMICTCCEGHVCGCTLVFTAEDTRALGAHSLPRPFLSGV